MMKKILLFSISIGFIALCSYKSGPAANGLNRTGAAGTTANCSTGGCHAANSTSTLVTVIVSKNGTPVTKFSPDSTYLVTISGAVANLALPKFGFQLAAVNGASTSTSVGTFTTVTASTAVRTVSGISIVEHTTQLSGVGTGNTWAYTAAANWKAPAAAANVNSVRFYAILNAVNNDGTDGGDQPNAATPYDLTNALAIGDVSQLSALQTFPNPATNMFHIMADAANGAYNMQIVNLAGQKMTASSINVVNGKLVATINADGWVAGMYFVSITDNAGNVKRIPVTKL